MQRAPIYGDTAEWNASATDEARYLIHDCLKTKIQRKTAMVVSHSVVQNFAPVPTSHVGPSFCVVGTSPPTALPETMLLGHTLL